MAKVSNLMVRIGADISQFQSEFGKLQSGLRNVGKSMQSTGKKLTLGLTTPIVGLGAASVTTYADFQSSMNKVKALSGATGKDFTKLENLAKEMGATTVFSASEAADGMSFLAMAGFDTNQIIETMPGMLDLAAASQMDLATAADITTNIMSGFGLEASEAGRIADVLALASQSANTDVEGMGEAMKYVAPVANGLGISVEETAAAIGIMSDAGIQGSQAGTTLRAGLSRLVNPVGQAKEAMDELGFSATDSEGNFKSLEQIVRELEDKTSHMTDAQRQQTLSMIFGQEAASGWTAMIENGADSLGGFTDELMNAEGTAAETADIMNSGLKGAFVELSSALEGLAISFGEILAPVIQAIAEKITDVVRWFNGLSTNMKTVIVVVASVVAAIGPLLAIVGTLMIFISELIPIVSRVAGVFTSTVAPVLAVIAVIGTLIAVVMHFWNTSETFREVVTTVFNAVKEVIMSVVETVVGFVEEIWGGLVEWWEENNEAILETVSTVWDTIVEVVSEVIETVREVVMEIFGEVVEFVKEIWSELEEWWIENNETILEALQNIWEGISTAVTWALETIWDIVQAVWPIIQQIISVAMDVIWGIMEFMWPMIKSLIIDTWEAIKGAIQGAIGVITGIIDLFSAVFTGDWGGMWDAIKKIVSSAVKLVWNLVKLWFVGKILGAGRALFSGLRGIVSNLWGTVRGLFSKGVGAARNIVSTGFNAVRSVVSTVMNAIRSVISNVWNAIRGVISKVLGGIRSTVSNIWGAIRNRISEVVNSIRGTISKIFNSLKGIVSRAFGGVRSSVSSGIKGALNTIKNMFSSFKNAGKNIITSIADGIKGAIGKVTGAMKNVVKKVRDFLPFSPAKEGPLRDIHKLDFGGPIGDSLDSAIPGVQAKLNTMLDIPDMTMSGEDIQSNKDGPKVHVEVDSSNDPPIYLVTPDGRVLAEYVADDVHNIGDRKNNRKKRRPKRR